MWTFLEVVNEFWWEGERVGCELEARVEGERGNPGSSDIAHHNGTRSKV